MNPESIGVLEELILLTVGSITQGAYALTILEEINEKAERNLDVTTIHSVLRRLDKKGYVTSEMGGATKERGGRRKRFFQLTAAGKTVLDENMELRMELYNKIPKFTFFSL
jgi:PadR family transcriptional regulator PadR